MKKIIFLGGLLCFSFLAVSKTANTIPVNPIMSISNFVNGEDEITLNLEKEAKVSIKLYDLQGGFVKSIKDEKLMKAGEHHIHVSLNNQNLKKGSYYRKVSVNGKVRKVKIITIH